jgi:hypothetical protein
MSGVPNYQLRWRDEGNKVQGESLMKKTDKAQSAWHDGAVLLGVFSAQYDIIGSYNCSTYPAMLPYICNYRRVRQMMAAPPSRVTARPVQKKVPED